MRSRSTVHGASLLSGGLQASIALILSNTAKANDILKKEREHFVEEGDVKDPPIHPGEIIGGDVLSALNMSVAEAAAKMGISRQTLHRIIHGQMAVTPEMALRIGKFCGNGPRLWLNMQTAHDLWHARQKLAADLARIPTMEA